MSQQIYSYDVTAGQSGAWYDPSHNGEGYFLQVISDTQAVVFWFSYDKNGDQLWMIGAGGEINGSRITFPEMLSPLGGEFGPDFDPDDVEYPVWGSLEFDFSSCSEGTANYSGPDEFGSGSLNLTRLTALWGLDCQGDDSHPISTGQGFLSAGFSGSWYDLTHNGEGFVVEVLNETTAIVIWFTYDTEGSPTWMLGTGTVDGASIIVGEFQTTYGGIFGPEFNPADVVYEPWGPAAYTFGSCAAGNMRYVPPPEFGFESNQFLNRLISIDGLQCDFLTDTYDIQATMGVAENIFLDGDVNNPNVPEVSNDPDVPAQQLVPPAKVAGFATAIPTEDDGDRFAEEIDEWDVYKLAIKKGESVSLNVSDWDPDNPAENDLDLYLANVNDLATTVDSSVSANQKEWVTAPEDGDYFVFVQAYAGTSNYLLKSGQSAPQASAKMSASAAMETGVLIASLKPKNTVASTTNKSTYKSRIEKIEKENVLNRIAESGNSDILYSVNTYRIDKLIPHPLTLIGRGSISPENWQVVRTAKLLSANNDYRWAGPNYIQSQLAIPNDPGYKYQWHYPAIKLPEAWDITTGSLDVVVAVIDTGVAEHPDLTNVDYSLGFDFVADTLNSGDGDGIDPDARDPGMSNPKLQDDLSHGTHVAGTVGATGNNEIGVTGVNWNVTIMPLRVLGVDGSGSCWAINESMKWAGQIDNGSGKLPAKKADIVNMSLGGSSACPGDQEIANQLVAKGIVIIAAAGNESTSQPSYPASLDGVINVSASTIADKLAPYSNYGATIDVAAPGGDSGADLNNDTFADGILSTVLKVDKGTTNRSFDFTFMQGTSMASPHMAGIAALMKAVYPEMGPTEFFTAISSGDIIIDLANNGLTNKDPSFGYGRIDVQKAVNWAKEKSQGQPGAAFLTSSISASDFGSTQLSVDFDIGKGGSGAISVTGGGTTDTWIQLYSVQTDNEGLGQYQIVVDRAGLIDGTYSGSAILNGSDGSKIQIAVTMQVGEKVDGEAGYLYALLLDTWTLGNVKQWEGLATADEFLMELESNPPGTYFLMVGSDIDNDFTICDPGEFCQVYPLSSQAGEIVVEDSDITLGNFTMQFPDDEIDGELSSASADSEKNAKNPIILELKEKIGNSGVSRK